MDKYEQIYQAAIKRAPSVTISGSFDHRDSEILFHKYPNLHAIISSFMVTGGGLFSRGVTLKIKYLEPSKSIDVDAAVVRASTTQEIINLIDKYVTRYEETFALMVPSHRVFNDALNIYIKKHAGRHPYLREISYKYITYGANTTIYPVIGYHVPSKELKSIEVKINEEVNRITKLLFEPGMHPLTKIMLAHNYLATTAIYDHLDITDKFNPYSHSAYGTLINHRSVCHGFADAFQRIMTRAGIKSEIVIGVINSNKENHAWNVVYVGDTEVYHIDVTWDIGSYANYSYFLKGDRFMLANRTWERSLYPACTSETANLFEAKKYIRLNKEKLLAKGVKPQMLVI